MITSARGLAFTLQGGASASYFEVRQNTCSLGYMSLPSQCRMKRPRSRQRRRQRHAGGNKPSPSPLQTVHFASGYCIRPPSVGGGAKWGRGMKTQPAALQAAEDDLKRLMADVNRAIEKAQEAMTKISANTATGTAGTETASPQRGFIPPANGAVPEPSCATSPT
jgi:hypothetical protein